MKIIKPGNPQKGWSKQFTCTGAGNKGGGCKAKLLVEQTDIYLTHSYHYDGSHEVYHTFQCPSCGVETDIPNSVSLPFSAREKNKAEKEVTKKLKGKD